VLETVEEAQYDFPTDAEEHDEKTNVKNLTATEIIRLQEENRKLKEELSGKKMDEQFLKDDVMVEYYMGLLCSAAVMDVLSQLLPCLPQTGRKCSPFQMLLLTPMGLRLNPIRHIAHLFD
ncbi:hypothetical protein XENOCAPTIV_022069, partial [Xenoophorus captivus]